MDLGDLLSALQRVANADLEVNEASSPRGYRELPHGPKAVSLDARRAREHPQEPCDIEDPIDMSLDVGRFKGPRTPALPQHGDDPALGRRVSERAPRGGERGAVLIQGNDARCVQSG